MEDVHFSNFLKHIPSSLQDEGNQFLKPQHSKYVFCKVLKNVGEYEIEDEEEILNLEKGKILVTKYILIDSLLLTEDVELI
jgi:hypothetical protein